MVPFVDNLPNSPICEGGDSANKAMEVNYLVSKDNICVFWKVYELVYLEQNLFEREDVLPPCEYFKPTYQVIRQYVLKERKKHLNDSFPPNCQVKKNLGRVYDNITNFASITFSPQVGRQIFVSSRSKTPHILYISVTFLAKRSL